MFAGRAPAAGRVGGCTACEAALPAYRLLACAATATLPCPTRRAAAAGQTTPGTQLRFVDPESLQVSCCPSLTARLRYPAGVCNQTTDACLLSCVAHLPALPAHPSLLSLASRTLPHLVPSPSPPLPTPLPPASLCPQDVPDGQQGLILAKGPGVMAGYFGDEGATAKVGPRCWHACMPSLRRGRALRPIRFCKRGLQAPFRRPCMAPCMHRDGFGGRVAGPLQALRAGAGWLDTGCRVCRLAPAASPLLPRLAFIVPAPLCPLSR